MTSETIDKLFLELSQITRAKTAREMTLESERDRAIGLRDMYLCDCQDYHIRIQSLEAENSTAEQWKNRAESENVKLTEKLAAAEKKNTAWDQTIMRLNAECSQFRAKLAAVEMDRINENAKLREKLAAAERERDEARYGHEAMCGVHDGRVKHMHEVEEERDTARQHLEMDKTIINKLQAEIDPLRKKLAHAEYMVEGLTSQTEQRGKRILELDAELARLKSSVPEAGQWAVTCDLLSERDARFLADEKNAQNHVVGKPYHAVPLAPVADDGPWVIRCLDSCGKNYVRHVTTREPGRPDISGHRRVTDVSEATRYETHELTDAMRHLVGNYYPVRLSDVKREGD